MPNPTEGVGSVPVTVKLEKGVRKASGTSYPMFVLRTPQGTMAVTQRDVDVLHTLLAHPKVGAIGAALGRKIVECAGMAGLSSGRECLSEETVK